MQTHAMKQLTFNNNQQTYINACQQNKQITSHTTTNVKHTHTHYNKTPTHTITQHTNITLITYEST